MTIAKMTKDRVLQKERSIQRQRRAHLFAIVSVTMINEKPISCNEDEHDLNNELFSDVVKDRASWLVGLL
eukprot:9011451-Ditylum_brightwellii.AAC.1